MVRRVSKYLAVIKSKINFRFMKQVDYSFTFWWKRSILFTMTLLYLQWEAVDQQKQ